MKEEGSPDWYDEQKLRKVHFDPVDWDEHGWVIDLGDGTCRYVNNPLRYLRSGPHWGDRVRLKHDLKHGWYADPTEVLEKYQKES